MSVETSKNEGFLVRSISWVKDNEYLLELVPAKLLKKRTRKERWARHDEYYGDDEDLSPMFMLGRMAGPIMIPLSALEYGELSPRVGMQVRLQVTPVGI